MSCAFIRDTVCSVWADEEAEGSGAGLLGGDRTKGPPRSRETPRPRLFFAAVLITFTSAPRWMKHSTFTRRNKYTCIRFFLNRILSLKKVGASLSNYQLIATNESCSVGLFVLGMQLCNCTWFLVNTSVFLCDYSPDPGFIHMHIVHSVAWLGQVYKCAIIWRVSKGWNHAWSGSILLSVKAILRTSCMTSSFIINNNIFLG